MIDKKPLAAERQRVIEVDAEPLAGDEKADAVAVESQSAILARQAANLGERRIWRNGAGEKGRWSQIGDGAVVGGFSVVTSDVAPNAIVAGNRPARSAGASPTTRWRLCLRSAGGTGQTRTSTR